MLSMTTFPMTVQVITPMRLMMNSVQMLAPPGSEGNELECACTHTHTHKRTELPLGRSTPETHVTPTSHFFWWRRRQTRRRGSTAWRLSLEGEAMSTTGVPKHNR